MLELNKIYLGDCLDLMPQIQDQSIDMVLCDLPYGTTACKWDFIIPFDKLWEQYKRIVKPNGNIILFASGRFVFELYASQPKLFRYDLVWQKSKCGSPFTAKYMPLKKHENILVFGKSGAYYKPQMQNGKPYKRNWTPNKTNNMKYGISGVQTNNIGTRHPSTVLNFPQNWRRQDQFHPTQKPVELLQWLIRSYCKEDGVVLDNTMGSGSTIIAAIKEKRQYIGIEKDKHYFEIAKERIKNETSQLSLF